MKCKVEFEYKAIYAGSLGQNPYEYLGEDIIIDKSIVDTPYGAIEYIADYLKNRKNKFDKWEGLRITRVDLLTPVNK